MNKSSTVNASITSTQLRILQKELHQAIAPFNKLDRKISITRFAIIGMVCLGSTIMAWYSHQQWAFILWTVFAAINYGFWLVCTHDAVHQTLTGWRKIDLWLARLISWPICWPVGIYSELHWLHHSRNGKDLRDPERVQWSRTEYEQASPIVRWYVRHQWAWNILVAGSFGLIGDAFAKGWHYRQERPQLHRQIALDLLGIILLHSGFFILVGYYGIWGKYILFWLIVEWVIGVMMQARAHLEHYDCWHPHESPLLTQLYSTRNVNGSLWVNWLMGGLPYHSIHHAFPAIPFNKLPQAYQAVQIVLQKYNQIPLEMERGYWQSTIKNSQVYSLLNYPKFRN